MIELVHIHIPKCGGMAFRGALEQVYGPGEVVGMPIVQELEEARAALHERRTERTRVVTGHAHVTTVLRRACAHHVTIVRDPLDRLVSWWHYASPRKAHGPPRDLVAWAPLPGLPGRTPVDEYMCDTFLEQLRSGAAGMHGWTLDNIVVRFFAGLPLSVGVRPVCDDDVKDALYVAERPTFTFFHMDEMYRALGAYSEVLRWSKPPTLPRVNLRPGSSVPPTERVRHALSDVFGDAELAAAMPLVEHDYAFFDALELNVRQRAWR